MTIAVQILSKLSASARAKLLLREETDLSEVIEKVRPLIAAVKSDGDAALVRFARQFDKADLSKTGLHAHPQDFARARQALPDDLKQAIEFAATNIRKFHEAQMPQPEWSMEIAPGVLAGGRNTAIPSVACYVPRGKGAFPSTVLMTCIPATVAGVADICILTPPGPNGHVDDATLYAAEVAGVSQIIKTGGAQAVAAVAYGTESIGRYAKFIGPGSPWVVAGQRLLADRIATGTPAGPSESIIFCDDTAVPELAARDLLIEAEHGPDSSAFLVTTSKSLAHAVQALLPALIDELSEPRRGYVSQVLNSSRGGILLAKDDSEAFAFINDYAPEHLEIMSDGPRAFLPLVKNAGEILLGHSTPSTLANYVLGPSHVLPTAGWGKTHSALSVHDFMKHSSVVEVNSSAYGALARHADTLTRYEGFEAHANALGDGTLPNRPRPATGETSKND